jgi:hypothetical protein
MKYRLFYHVYDYTSEDDPGIETYQTFYARDDEAAKKRIKYFIRYALQNGVSVLTPLKLLRIIQRKTKYKEEVTQEVIIQ